MRLPYRVVGAMVSAALLALYGAAVAPAPAATLYTTPAHTALVAGWDMTGHLTTTAGLALTASSGVGLVTCADSGFDLIMLQNTTAAVSFAAFTPTSSGCTASPFSLTGGATRLVVTGSFTPRTGGVSWASTVESFAFDLQGGAYSGTVAGVTAFQPLPATAPLCFLFTGAGTFSGPLTSTGRVDAKYCLTGAAATWSLT